MRLATALPWVLLHSLVLGEIHAQVPGDGPLQVLDIVALARSGVPASEVEAILRRRHLAFPPTPAIRRYLARQGVGPGVLLAAWPQVEDGQRVAIESAGLSFVRPPTWKLSGETEAWTLARDRTPPRMTAEVSLRTFPLDPVVLRGENPEVLTLQDLLVRQAVSYTKDQGYAGRKPDPLPARGITGASLRLVLDRPGEPRSLVILTAFTRRKTLLLVRAHLRGPADDPFILAAEAELVPILASFAPHTGSSALDLPIEDPRVRILVIEFSDADAQLRTPDETHLRLLDRSGRVREDLPAEGIHALLADPLALRAGWRVGATLHELGAGPPVVELPSPGAETLRIPDECRFVPGQPGFWGAGAAAAGFPLALADATWGDAAVDPEGTTVTFATGTKGRLHLRQVRLSDRTEATDPRVAFEPAHVLCVVDDPGTASWLVAVHGTYHPLPVSGAPPPTTVGRLLYAPKDGGEDRLLLTRSHPGEGTPLFPDRGLPVSPRFLPSGFEVLYLEPGLGLCVIPRDGGLPVLLREHAVAAEPWIDRR